MAQTSYANEAVVVRPPVTDWGTIWAGVFSFIAIWSVFGLLAMAVFASAGSPSTASANSGVSIGMGIWAIALSIMNVRCGSRNWPVGSVSSPNGLIDGMIMFGLWVAATAVIVVLLRSIVSFGTSVAEANTPTC
jgi:hypothetical protein